MGKIVKQEVNVFHSQFLRDAATNVGDGKIFEYRTEEENGGKNEIKERRKEGRYAVRPSMHSFILDPPSQSTVRPPLQACMHSRKFPEFCNGIIGIIILSNTFFILKVAI